MNKGFFLLVDVLTFNTKMVMFCSNIKNMKKIVSLLTLILFASTIMPALAQKTDSSNVYKEMKKNVKDITGGVITDTKDALKGVDSAFKNLADSSQISFGSVYKDIRSGIEGMAAALKVGAAHVYEVLVRQQVAKSIVILIVFIAGIIFLIVAWKRAKIADWNADYGKDDNDKKLTGPNGWAVLDIVFWVLGIICVIYGICRIQTMITGFVNPEYGAMEDIVDFVKRIKGGQ